MRSFQVLAAAFATFMLVRHGPGVLRLVRGEGSRANGVVAALNVLLAVAVLVAAVKGLARVLISR